VEALHDGIADVDYRVTLSPGAGYYLIKQTNIFFRVELGPGYVFEKLGGITHDYATLRIGERFEWKITERAKLFQSAEYLPQVDKFENYVINAEIGLDTAITKRLSQVTLIQDSYRSEPAPGRLHNDLKLIAGLKYKLL
jgi:putative salt-induced outer membrane protein YdiY